MQEEDKGRDSCLRRALRRRSTVVFAFAIATASIPIMVHVAAPAAAPRAALRPAQICEGDRWDVKTLEDRARLRPAEPSSIRALGSMPRPISLTSARAPQEQQLYVVSADVIAIDRHSDGDLHVLLRAGGRTMIAEAPSPACTRAAWPARRQEMQRARHGVRACRARVVGVLFFDLAAGQYGHAPNYAELHPLVSFHCLSFKSVGSVRQRVRLSRLLRTAE
jgi:hypothetical protein